MLYIDVTTVSYLLEISLYIGDDLVI